MNYKIILLLLFLINPLFLVANTLEELEGIRGYKFGETRSYVQITEAKKKEYTLNASQTNQHILAYKGTLFNKKMDLLYRFRKGRLGSLSYVWTAENPDSLFYQDLLDLLELKYKKPKVQSIPTLNSAITINSYTKYLEITNKNKKITQKPLLHISLEKIQFSNNTSSPNSDDITVEETFILEFRPFDSDTTIQDQILLEDI